MHLKSMLVGLALGLGLAVAVGLSAPKPTPIPSPAPLQDMPEMSQEDMAQMMELMQKYAAPGPEHRKLASLAGEWTGEFDMMGMKSEHTQTVSAILGGRFVLSHVKGTMMGQPMEGYGILGYDNFKKKYTSIWLDNMGTMVHYSEGLANRDGSELIFFGTMDEYMTGQHDKPVKYVYRFHSDDAYEFEIHDLGIVPGETKVLSGTFRRSG